MYEKELMEKKNDLMTRYEGVITKAKMEKRELTEAEAAELAEIRDNVKHIKDTIDAMDFAGKEGAKGEPPVKAEVEVEKEVQETRELEKRAADERAAFDAFIRGKVNERANNLTPAEGSGQVLIPTTIAREIIKKVYDISPILDKSQKMNVKGNLKIPYYDESNTAITVAYANEFEELASNVGSFTTIELTGFLAGTLSLISRSLINNSQFDVVGFVVDRMAYDIHRFIEGELLNGTVGKVTGLSDLTNTMTAAAETAITADEVIKLKDNIKDVFQPNAIWIMSPATRTALRLLKDEVGRYLLQDDITSPFGTTLLGKPIYVTDNMADMAAGKTAIYYGDMTGLTTKFSEDMNIEVLREKYATQHAIGVVGWLEFDSKVNDAQKITALKMASA
jgi:HK97 family phage major capsid protein